MEIVVTAARTRWRRRHCEICEQMLCRPVEEKNGREFVLEIVGHSGLSERLVVE